MLLLLPMLEPPFAASCASEWIPPLCAVWDALMGMLLAVVVAVWLLLVERKRVGVSGETGLRGAARAGFRVGLRKAVATARAGVPAGVRMGGGVGG